MENHASGLFGKEGDEERRNAVTSGRRAERIGRGNETGRCVEGNENENGTMDGEKLR